MFLFRKKEKKSIYNYTQNLYNIAIIESNGAPCDSWIKSMTGLLMNSNIKADDLNQNEVFFYEIALVSIELFGLAVMHTQKLDIAVKQGIATKEYFIESSHIWDDLMSYNRCSSKSATEIFRENVASSPSKITALNAKKVKGFDPYAGKILKQELLQGVALAINRTDTIKPWKKNITPVLLSAKLHERLDINFNHERNLYSQLLIGKYNAYVSELSNFKWV